MMRIEHLQSRKAVFIFGFMAKKLFRFFFRGDWTLLVPQYIFPLTGDSRPKRSAITLANNLFARVHRLRKSKTRKEFPHNHMVGRFGEKVLDLLCHSGLAPCAVEGGYLTTACFSRIHASTTCIRILFAGDRISENNELDAMSFWSTFPIFVSEFTSKFFFQRHNLIFVEDLSRINKCSILRNRIDGMQSKNTFPFSRLIWRAA